MTKRLMVLMACATLSLATGGCSDDEVSDEGSGGDGGTDATTVGSGGEGGSTIDEYVVLVRGELYTDDLVEAQGYHDGLASGGEEAANALGDFGHDAMLGTDLLGTTPGLFMGLDRWDNLVGLQSFYADPQFADAFGMLFSSPPTVETFAHMATWHGWGSLTSGDASDPHYFVVVRGRLANADMAENQAAHDAVAAGGQASAEAAGDQAHVVFIGAEDPREFLAIDIWHESANIESLYTNPDFAAAFGSLFSSPPTIAVYASTAWHQW